jgi:hypothetical protein
MFEESLNTAELEQQILDLRQANLTLQQKLIKAKAKTDELVDATYQAAYDCFLNMGGLNEVPAPKKDRRKAREQVALWHLTDWQLGKETPTYNTEVCKDRVRLFRQKARTLTEVQRAAHPVKKCWILLGGDMLESVFQFPTQVYEIDSTLHAQLFNVVDLIVETVRDALDIYEYVHVVPEWGNHGRIGSKRDAVVKSDNFDRFAYEMARRMLEGQSRLTWQDCPEDIQKIYIPPNTPNGSGYRAILIHGDEVGRNGFASSTTLVAAVGRWQAGAFDYPFTDCYTGHFHSHYELPVANGTGSVFQTGSTESSNRYAQIQLAVTSTPSQRLHFIDPDKGRVVSSMKVWLDE